MYITNKIETFSDEFDKSDDSDNKKRCRLSY